MQDVAILANHNLPNLRTSLLPPAVDSVTEPRNEHLQQTRLTGLNVKGILSQLASWLETADFKISDPEKSKNLEICNDSGLNEACRPLLQELGIYNKVLVFDLLTVLNLQDLESCTTYHIRCNSCSLSQHWIAWEFGRFCRFSANPNYRKFQDFKCWMVDTCYQRFSNYFRTGSTSYSGLRMYFDIWFGVSGQDDIWWGVWKLDDNTVQHD